MPAKFQQSVGRRGSVQLKVGELINTITKHYTIKAKD